MEAFLKVSPDVALRRLNRRFENARVHKARGSQIEEAGRYFLVKNGRVAQRHVDLESLSREKGALREHEILAAV